MAGLDVFLLNYYDFARQVLEDDLDIGKVGDHVRIVAEDNNLVSHYFECLHRGYPGWMWIVVLARVPGGEHVTVCEIYLLPGNLSKLAVHKGWESQVVACDDVLMLA